jgi:hypothetical protein
MLHTPISCAVALVLTLTAAATATAGPVSIVVHGPAIAAVGVADLTQTSATLHVTVAGHGLPVTVTATVRGSRGVVVATAVPVVVTADGDVALPVSGLQPRTVYRWTATAKSTEGPPRTTLGTPALFRTLPLTPMPRPALSPARAVYGSSVTVSGTLLGAPALPVALQAAPFPYAFPFVPVAGADGATDADGSYRFTVQALATTRYGVVAPGYEGPTKNNAGQLTVVPAVVVHARRARARRTVVSGSYRPDAAAWITLFRIGHGRAGDMVDAVPAGDGGRRFRFPARVLTPGAYEVRLTMSSATGLGRTHSAPFTIPRR